MSRILRHVGGNDHKRTRQRLVDEQKSFIKNIKISDSIFDTFPNVSNWREELIDEGMSSKDFPHLYGYGISIFDVPITSTIQNPVQSTLAQDIVNASAETTDYAFGPQFPGSYANQVGGVESLSKVDAQAALGDLEDESRNDLKRAYYADGGGWDGSYQGPDLPADPWNNDPVEITGTEGQDYQQILDVRVDHGTNRISTHSIRLQAGQEYDFRILKYSSSRGIYPPSGSANAIYDSVLSLQDENGELVAFNDDEFATYYNQTIGPAEYGYAIQPNDSHFGPDGETDLVPQYDGGDVEEFVPGIGIWNQLNTVKYNPYEDGGSNTETNFTFDSRITYTPTTTGTYYLVIRDYRDRGSDILYNRLRVSGLVPPPAAAPAVVDQRSRTQKTTDAADLGAPVAAFDPKVDKKRREDEEQYQAYAKDLMQRLQKIKNTSTKEPQYSPDDYYGPAFGDNATANQQRMNNLYDYWKNNYKPAQQKQPFSISPITANDMPGPVKDFANNFPDYRNTEWGQNLDRLQNDPVWGPIINAGVSAVGAVAGSPQAARYAQRGMVNPFGQRTTVRSGAAGRAQVPVYRGRPYQGDLKIGGGGPAFGTVDPKVAGTYTQSGALRGTPGMAQSPQGTVDRGTLPQRYIDKYGGRSVLGQQQIKMSPSAAARTFGGTVTQPTQSKTLQNLTKVGATAAGAAAVLDAGAAEPNVSGKDLNKRISDRLPGYSIGDFSATGKGDHYTAPILDPQGNPVMNPRTGKPVTIGGGLRGKNQYSNSALGTLTNAINDIKGGFADKTGQAKGSTKVSDAKTKPVTKTASKTQPKSSTRSTIKSMPASMMGKPPAPEPTPTKPPLRAYKNINIPNLPSRYRNIRFDYEMQGNLIAEKKMKSFNQLKKELYPGQPSPNGFPDTPPAQMSPNGYHSEYGKQGKMYNRMDRATAMAMPLTKDPEIDAKILAARNQPK